MSPIRATPVDPWRTAPFVLAVDGEPAGAITLVGIEQALEQVEGRARGQRIRSLVDLEIKPEPESVAQKWLADWQRVLPKKPAPRDLVVRDNKNDRYLRINRCFFSRIDMRGAGTLVINGVEIVEGP